MLSATHETLLYLYLHQNKHGVDFLLRCDLHCSTQNEIQGDQGLIIGQLSGCLIKTLDIDIFQIR